MHSSTTWYRKSWCQISERQFDAEALTLKSYIGAQPTLKISASEVFLSLVPDLRVPVTSIKKPNEFRVSSQNLSLRHITSTKNRSLNRAWCIMMCRNDGFLDVSRWRFAKITFRGEGYLGLKKNDHCVKVTGTPDKHIIYLCIRNVKKYHICLLISFIKYFGIFYMKKIAWPSSITSCDKIGCCDHNLRLHSHSFMI